MASYPTHTTSSFVISKLNKMENQPTPAIVLFIILTIVTLYLLYRATNKSKMVLIVVSIWLILQGISSSQGFYLITNTLPPRFALVIFPPMVLIAMLFITQKGRDFIDQCSPKNLTIIHTVRIFVEFGLYTLYIHKYVPRIMTFEGRNLDILSGLTAPFIVYFGYYKTYINKKLLLAWNFICLGLVLNIVVIAVLSAPFKFQQFGFDRPNVAIIHFPYIWLPAFIVPVVIFAHLVSIRDLIIKKSAV